MLSGSHYYNYPLDMSITLKGPLVGLVVSIVICRLLGGSHIDDPCLFQTPGLTPYFQSVCPFSFPLAALISCVWGVGVGYCPCLGSVFTALLCCRALCGCNSVVSLFLLEGRGAVMNGRSVLSDVSFAPAELTIWFSLFSLLVWQAPFLEAADSVEASYVGQAQSLWCRVGAWGFLSRVAHSELLASAVARECSLVGV